jgi:outer membrane protein assembly factor BamB
MRLRLAALTALAALAAPSAAAAAGLPAVPIPSDPRDPLVLKFTGAPAVPQPLGAQPVPRHPFMAPNGASNIHDDAYQTDAYDGPGPLGRNLTVRSTLFTAECASVTFDSHGRIVTVCVSPTGATLRLIDPDTLATLASHELPARKLGTFSFSNFAGGGYFYLDDQDRAVLTTFTGHLQVYAEAATGTGPAFRIVRDVDLTPATAGADIISALPDWSGRIWFVTTSGVVGFVAPDDSVHSLALPAGETIANSFAVDESGGVFVVSTHALYRFDVGGGAPIATWRQPYDRGVRVKPSQVSQGSGTTPTLIGSASSPGGGAVAITDNADPRMHVLVFRRGPAGPGPAPLCEQPVFPAGEGADENSLIAVPGGLIAENNYGYAGPVSGLRTADTTPGLVRIDVDPVDGGCHVAWENTTARIPTLVSKASLATGLVYTYTHPSAAEVPMLLRAPDLLVPDAWFLTAFDARTGRQVWSRHVGSGLGYNNNYAPVTLGPDGAAYVGTLGGLVRISDG